MSKHMVASHILPLAILHCSSELNASLVWGELYGNVSIYRRHTQSVLPARMNTKPLLHHLGERMSEVNSAIGSRSRSAPFFFPHEYRPVFKIKIIDP